MKIIERLRFYNSIKLLEYIKLNYFSKNIKREGKGKIIPFKGAVIDIDPSAEVILKNSDILLGTNKLKRSKAESYLRLRENSSWEAANGCDISYGSTLELLQNAHFSSGFFSMNSFSTIVVDDCIEFGEDVMIARKVVIYDSDFHTILRDGSLIRKSKTVRIGNHVWIGTGSFILKGVNIGDGSMIAAGTIVTMNVSNDLVISGSNNPKVLMEHISWER